MDASESAPAKDGDGLATGEADLACRAKAGDGAAFAQLVARHERAMLAIARAHFAVDADARDAVHEAFLKAFRALDSLNDACRFAAWLAAITTNTCHDILRSRSDRVSLTQLSSTVNLSRPVARRDLTPASAAVRGELIELVRAATGRLPEGQRVAILLRYVEHRTYEEIAGYLDVPVSTVRGRLYHAKQALRDMLQGHFVELR